MSFNLGSSMMESMFSLNETEAGFTLPKPVTEAPFSPIFSPEEEITANSSVTETVNEILNDPLLEDQHVVPEPPEDTNSNDRSSTAPTKLKNKRLTEKRCKQSNTLLKKTKELHAYTGLSVLTIVKDKLGKIIIAGSPDLEEKLLNGEPIVEVEKQPILKWVNDKLSLEKCLPEPKIVPSPVKEIIPAQLKHSIPGAAPAVKDLAADFVAKRGSSTIKSFSLVKEKDQKSAEQPAAKKTKQSKKKVVINGNSSAKSTTKPTKRPYT